MGKQEVLTGLLEKLKDAVPEIKALLLASPDGLVIAAEGDPSTTQRLAAMAASTHGLGQRIARTAELGTVHEVSVLGDEGQFVVYPMGPAILALATRQGANFGLVRLEVDNLVPEITRALEGGQ